MDNASIHDLGGTQPTHIIKHVHIGAGRFGLGMVMDMCHTAGFLSTVMNRSSKTKHHEALKQAGHYAVIYDGKTDQKKSINAEFTYYDSVNDREALNILANPAVSLITTAVRKDNLEEIAPLLALAIAQREGNNAAPLCILACENMPSNSTILKDTVRKSLSGRPLGYFHRHVTFCNTLVDRVCSNFEYDDEGIPQVSVESFYEWIVENPSIPIDAIGQLRDRNLIKLVDEKHFKAYERRKYWCFNAVHLAVAAFAFIVGNITKISAALESEGIRTIVTELQDEIAFALRVYTARQGLHNLFSEEALLEYNAIILRRLRENKSDTVARILKQSELSMSTSFEQLLAGTLEQLNERANQNRRREHLAASIGKAAEFLDTHEILDRVVERFIAPALEILSFLRDLPDSDLKTRIFFRKVKSEKRLLLDDAIQASIIAIERYYREQYAGLRACVARDVPATD